MNSLKRQKYYNFISEKLGLLSNRIKINGKLNILDLNIHSETFYRDFLNILYNCEFESANVGKSNYEAVDLFEKDEKVVLQVTSTVTTNKINDTLKKEKIKDFASSGYKIQFIFIADTAEKLRKRTFDNLYDIDFNPREDLIDTAVMLEKVTQLPIDKLMILHDFFRNEFGEKPNPKRISSNLITIVKNLAKENLGEVNKEPELDEFNIIEKINFNELIEIKDSTFDEYKIYYGILDGVYQEFEREGSNKVISVFRKLISLYERELINRDATNIEKFFNIIEKVEQDIVDSELIEVIPEEEIEMCVRIIVVDAFIRCKIFKNPRGYSHVAPQ